MKLPRVTGAVAAWQLAPRCGTTSRGCACWSRCTRGSSPPSHGSSGSLSGPGRNRRWEVLQAKWSCCSADRRRRCESCDGFPPSIGGGGGLQVDLFLGKERVKSPSPGTAPRPGRATAGAPRKGREPGTLRGAEAAAGRRAGRAGAALPAPPLAAVAQCSLQSLALRSTDGVCSASPHLPAYLATAGYLWLPVSLALLATAVPAAGSDKAHPNSWLVAVGSSKALEGLGRVWNT